MVDWAHPSLAVDIRIVFNAQSLSPAELASIEQTIRDAFGWSWFDVRSVDAENPLLISEPEEDTNQDDNKNRANA